MTDTELITRLKAKKDLLTGKQKIEIAADMKLSTSTIHNYLNGEVGNIYMGRAILDKIEKILNNKLT